MFAIIYHKILDGRESLVKERERGQRILFNMSDRRRTINEQICLLWMALSGNFTTVLVHKPLSTEIEHKPSTYTQIQPNKHFGSRSQTQFWL